MSRHYVFNGDADGLCALQQLRLFDPCDALLTTGVKRDINLLRRVDAKEGDEVTVLDISLDENRADLFRLLESGVRVRYFDHHYAGRLPSHARFEAHIDETADVCTGVLVDRYLGGRYRSWAIVAAFGDGLSDLGQSMAEVAGIDPATVATMERLGICLNYNAYGETIGDLHFDPAILARQMLPFADPLDFVRHSTSYSEVRERFDEDMQHAQRWMPARQVPGAIVMVLPDAPWAKRTNGVLANQLMRSHPDCAIAVLLPKACGGFTASVRVPAAHAVGAADFCRIFETGGGRRLAAGINHLPDSDVRRFTETFESQFCVS